MWWRYEITERSPHSWTSRESTRSLRAVARSPAHAWPTGVTATAAARAARPAEHHDVAGAAGGPGRSRGAGTAPASTSRGPTLSRVR